MIRWRIGNPCSMQSRPRWRMRTRSTSLKTCPRQRRSLNSRTTDSEVRTVVQGGHLVGAIAQPTRVGMPLRGSSREAAEVLPHSLQARQRSQALEHSANGDEAPFGWPEGPAAPLPRSSPPTVPTLPTGPIGEPRVSIQQVQPVQRQTGVLDLAFSILSKLTRVPHLADQRHAKAKRLSRVPLGWELLGVTGLSI